MGRELERNHPLFMLTFDKQQNTQEIYKIVNILGLRERMNYCKKDLSYVKKIPDARKHLTNNCKKKECQTKSQN